MNQIDNLVGIDIDCVIVCRIRVTFISNFILIKR